MEDAATEREGAAAAAGKGTAAAADEDTAAAATSAAIDTDGVAAATPGRLATAVDTAPPVLGLSLRRISGICIGVDSAAASDDITPNIAILLPGTGEGSLCRLLDRAIASLLLLCSNPCMWRSSSTPLTIACELAHSIHAVVEIVCMSPLAAGERRMHVEAEREERNACGCITPPSCELVEEEEEEGGHATAIGTSSECCNNISDVPSDSCSMLSNAIVHSVASPIREQSNAASREAIVERPREDARRERWKRESHVSWQGWIGVGEVSEEDGVVMATAAAAAAVEGDGDSSPSTCIGSTVESGVANVILAPSSAPVASLAAAAASSPVTILSSRTSM
jgi:hypothetical protein